MISKELFVEAIDSIMHLKDYQNDKHKLCKKYGADGYLIEPSNDAILIKVIKNLFKGCDEIDCIDTFCFVNNFGRGKGNQEYMDSDGQRIKITSSSELYDYLLTKMKSDGGGAV